MAKRSAAPVNDWLTPSADMRTSIWCQAIRAKSASTADGTRFAKPAPIPDRSRPAGSEQLSARGITAPLKGRPEIFDDENDLPGCGISPVSKAEARKVYRTSHLYWHGKGRCWDASSGVSHRHQKVGAARLYRVEASHKAKARPKPEVVDASPVSTRAKRTQTLDDLRTWPNSMAAMTAEPTVTILDRWPAEELPHHWTKPTAGQEPSLMNARTIIMVIIMFMVLLAVLIEVTVHRRKVSGAALLRWP